MLYKVHFPKIYVDCLKIKVKNEKGFLYYCGSNFLQTKTGTLKFSEIEIQTKLTFVCYSQLFHSSVSLTLPSRVTVYLK